MIAIPIDPAAPLVAQVRPYGIEQRGAASGERLYVFTRQDEVIYVGVTCNIPERWQQHKNRADWWPLVDAVKVSPPYPHKPAAEAVEVALIHSLQPIGNRRSRILSDGVTPVRVTSGSLSDHAQITDCSVNGARLDHWGNGMEGNGREWKGRLTQVCDREKSVSGQKMLPPSLRSVAIGTAEADILPRNDQLKSVNRPQTARAVWCAVRRGGPR